MLATNILIGVLAFWAIAIGRGFNSTGSPKINELRNLLAVRREKFQFCLAWAQVELACLLQPGVLRRSCKLAFVVLMTVVSLSCLSRDQVSPLAVFFGFCLFMAVLAGAASCLLCKSCEVGHLLQGVGKRRLRDICTGVVWAGLASFGCGSAMAQEQPNLQNGMPPNGSYDSSSVDTVNLMNGNLILHIPLPFDTPQRGKLGIKYYLVLNSKTWKAYDTPAPGQWMPMSACGTGSSGPCGQGPLFVSTASFSMTRIWQRVWTDGQFPDYSASIPDSVVTWDGAVHPIGGDTSGYSVQVSGDDGNGVYTTATLIDRNGVQYSGSFSRGNCTTDPGNGLPGATQTTTCYEQWGLSSVTDANGNVLNPPIPIPGIDSQGGPSVGAHAAVGSELAGCLTSFGTPWVYYFNYPAPNGQTNQLKLCFAPYPQLATSFSQPGVHQFQDVYSGHPFPGNWRPPIYLANIIFPDNTQWSINYDSYGEITSVGTPTGASIQYGWGEGSFPACNVAGNDITKVSRAVQSRTVTDVNGHSFTRTYQWAPQASDGTLSHTVTDPSGNDSVHTFVDLTAAWITPSCDFRETRTVFYQGSGGSRTALKQVDTSWLNSRTGGAYGVPSEIKTTLFPGNKVSLVHKDYASDLPFLDLVISQKIYDWGQGAPGALLKETDTTYQWQSNNNYLTANLLDIPASVITRDGSGNQVAETDYVYDEPAYLTSYTGTLPSGSQVSAPNGTVRGNPTTVRRWLNSSNTFIPMHTNWYDIGEPYQQIDTLGNITTHYFDAAYAGALPTKTCNALNQCVSATYDSNTGLVTSFTDANASFQANGTMQGDSAHTWNYAYDFMSRMTLAQGPPDPGNGGARGQTLFGYPSATTLQVQKAITASLTDSSTVYFDGLGHAYQTQHSTPAGTVYADTTFDGLGHVASVTNPYYAITDETYGATTTQYDALGRATQVVISGGSPKTVSYDNNCSTTADETGKQRKSCSDALGRLTAVFEDPSSLNYETDYQYDALGNLLRVDQKGSAPTDSSQWRTRIFTYDSLSRLLTANNPESGQITYTYDANGNLSTKTDARGVVITYTYDAMSRLTHKTFSDGTIGHSFYYDAPIAGYFPNATNVVGRLVWRTNNVNTASAFSYDVMGRVIYQTNWTPSSPSGSSNPTYAGYDLAGNVTSLTYPSGRVVKYGYNSGNQLNQVTFDSFSGMPVGYNYWSVANIDFYPTGTPKKQTLGNGVVETFGLNRALQFNRAIVSNPGIQPSPFADHFFQHSPDGLHNNGNVIAVIDELNPAYTQTFTYDALNRLASASESRWGMNYVYDAWGNYLQQNQTGGSTYQHQYVALLNNRLGGYSYDAAGNILNDGFHAYVYDPENQIKSADSGASTYTYDDSGSRVRKDVSGSSSIEYIYFGGNPIAEHDVTRGTWSDYIYAGGKRIAKSDNFEDRIYTHATVCAGCGWQWYQWGFLNDPAVGRVVQAGDKIMWRQYQVAGPSSGIDIVFSDGTESWSAGVNLLDQHGEGLSGSAINNTWNNRVGDMSPAAGKTITAIRLVSTGTANSWQTFYQNLVYVGADGTVFPLYNHNQAVSVSGFGMSGVTQPVAEINRDSNATYYSWWASTMYYHGDQIGSSRLMTSDGGWPVWQGTFLPYGEEYNPQITTNHYKFTGKERDSETGLDYFGARYYSNGLGRFITPDWATKATAVPYAEFADPQSLNLYSYVRNVPTTRFDPDGHLTDFYSPDGKKLGNDGVNNGAVAIAPYGVDKAPNGIVNDATTIVSVEISREVGVEIQASVARTEQPSGGDTKGGFHEEGFTQDKDGTIHIAQSGPAYKPTDTEAHVNKRITSNTAIDEHTHPSGTKDGGGSTTIGGTRFNPKPSPPDIKNAGNTPAIGQQIVHIEASAGDRTVYFYNDKGVYAQVPLSAFPEK